MYACVRFGFSHMVSILHYSVSITTTCDVHLINPNTKAYLHTHTHTHTKAYLSSKHTHTHTDKHYLISTIHWKHQQRFFIERTKGNNTLFENDYSTSTHYQFEEGYTCSTKWYHKLPTTSMHIIVVSEQLFIGTRTDHTSRLSKYATSLSCKIP